MLQLPEGKQLTLAAVRVCEIHVAFKTCSSEPAATMKPSLMAMPKDTDDVYFASHRP